MTAHTTLALLVATNLALQLFDGIATYIGWVHFGEMNPILRRGFEVWGAGPTLLTAKTLAIALIIVLARAPHRTLASAGLTLTLIAYVALSFVPWTSRLMG